MSGGLEAQTHANCTNELTTSAQHSPNTLPKRHWPVVVGPMVRTHHDDGLPEVTSHEERADRMGATFSPGVAAGHEGRRR